MCMCMNSDDFTVLVSGAIDPFEWAHVCVAIAFKMTEQVEQQTCIRFSVKFEHFSSEAVWMIQKAMGNWWLAGSSQYIHSCFPPHEEFFGETSNHLAPYGPDLVPCDFWLFPKLKSPLKGKRFQTTDEIQENTIGQLMATGRTVWSPMVPSLKGTEVSLFCVRCFLLHLFQ